MPRKRGSTGYAKGFPVSPSKKNRTKKALFQVKSEGVSISTAARQNGLSYSYLQRRLSGEVGIASRNGPTPILTQEEEEEIANYATEMALRGMRMTPADIMDIVHQLLTKEKRPNPFKDNRTGYRWWYNFMARHEGAIQMRKETNLDGCRSKVTAGKMDTWFENYKDFVSDLELLDKPHRIWNGDETGFSMGSKGGMVLGPSKTVYAGPIPHDVSGGSGKERLTVMYCANAEGTLMPPFLVYPEPRPTAYDPLTGATRGA